MSGIDATPFTIDCTGDACIGDVILFTEGVFAGSIMRPRWVGQRTIVATVIHDSYGVQKGQHTFTLLVIASEGFRPLAPGVRTTRKARNVYRHSTRRMPWVIEKSRHAVLEEKHYREQIARRPKSVQLNLEFHHQPNQPTKTNEETKND